MRVEWIVNEHLPGLNPVQFGSSGARPPTPSARRCVPIGFCIT